MGLQLIQILRNAIASSIAKDADAVFCSKTPWGCAIVTGFKKNLISSRPFVVVVVFDMTVRLKSRYNRV